MARSRWHVLGVALVGLFLVTAGCSSEDSTSSSAPSPSAPVASATAADTSVCGYLFEWARTFRFPLQPDPHAAYSYVMPKLNDQPIGFEISGPFPYAAWTEWMVYTGFDKKAQPYSTVKDSDITPDAGSVNPFVPGTRVLAKNRSYRLLVLPHGTDNATLARQLGDIPASNILTSPPGGGSFIIANRVYNAFPGYNQGGAAGPTDTAFPTVRAVDLKTGNAVDCSRLNLLPKPSAPTDMPTGSDAADGPVTLAGGSRSGVGLGSVRPDHTGAEYAPALDPDLVEFTRPPLLPGADVSSIPPADNCAGYLGAATSTTKIGMVRIPQVPRWFDTTRLEAHSTFAQEQTTYVSLTQYGASVSTYDSGSPSTASLANEELLVDESGGATVVIWPRTLTGQQQRQVVDIADRNGWALMRGGSQGEVTTANLFLRMKGTSPSYQGGFVPGPQRPGVPCYFDDHPRSTSWANVTGTTYVASAATIGGAAPQGVNCSSVQAFLDGSCLADLKGYIISTGGSYR